MQHYTKKTLQVVKAETLKSTEILPSTETKHRVKLGAWNKAYTRGNTYNVNILHWDTQHHLHQQQQYALQQVFDILLCLHSSLSSAADWSATKPSSFAISCSIWILLLHLVGLTLILPSIISCKSRSCLKTWPLHFFDVSYLCQMVFSIRIS